MNVMMLGILLCFAGLGEMVSIMFVRRCSISEGMDMWRGEIKNGCDVGR